MPQGYGLTIYPLLFWTITGLGARARRSNINVTLYPRVAFILEESIHSGRSCKHVFEMKGCCSMIGRYSSALAS